MFFLPPKEKYARFCALRSGDFPGFPQFGRQTPLLFSPAPVFSNPLLQKNKKTFTKKMQLSANMCYNISCEKIFAILQRLFRHTRRPARGTFFIRTRKNNKLL